MFVTHATPHHTTPRHRDATPRHATPRHTTPQEEAANQETAETKATQEADAAAAATEAGKAQAEADEAKAAEQVDGGGGYGSSELLVLLHTRAHTGVRVRVCTPLALNLTPYSITPFRAMMSQCLACRLRRRMRTP